MFDVSACHRIMYKRTSQFSLQTIFQAADCKVWKSVEIHSNIFETFEHEY